MTDAGRLLIVSLGAPRLVGTTGLTLPCARKELAVLVYLMRRPLQQATRDELAAAFWGDRGDERARHSLRQTLHRLRPLVGQALEVTADRVRVAAGTLALDATLFEREIADGDVGGAVTRWEGELLQGAEDAGAEPYRAWLDAERAGLRRQLTFAFTRLAEAAAAFGDSTGEAAWLERWCALVPACEEAHVRLVRVLARQGRLSDALGRHASFVTRLRDDIGIEPSPALRSLIDSIERRVESADRTIPGSAALLTPDYVGGPVLDTLRRWWLDARARSVVAVVYGAEGLGKTRVCAELARGVTRDEPATLVLESQAREEDTARPAYVTACRLLDAIAHATGVDDAPSRAVADAAGLLPTLRTRFPHVAFESSSASGSDAPLAEACAALLGAVAARTPVLIVLDDAECADEASQRLLAAMARRLPAGVMLVLTTRPGERSGPLFGELRQVPAVRALRLAPLSRADVDSLVGSMLMLRPADRTQLADRVFGEAGGNPFFTIELIASLADSGRLGVSPDGYWRPASRLDQAHPLPSSIREAIGARLEQLGADARCTLDAAAVIGRAVSIEGLAAVTRLPVERLDDAIGVLVVRRLMRPSPDRVHEYDFAHTLFRRAAYELIPTTRRREMHAAALALAGDGPDGPPGASGGARHRDALRELGATERPPSRRWRRVAGIGAAAAVAAAVLVGTIVRRNEASPGLTSQQRRLVVLPLTNTTGDRRVDPLGRIAADWLTHTIAQSGIVHVVPLTHVGPGSAAGSTPGGPVDLRKVAASAEADVAVWGSLEPAGDSIRLRVWITDARGGTLLGAVAPVVAAAADPMSGVELLGEHTLAALAHHVDPRLAPAAARQSVPPSYEAYRAFAEGLEALIARRGREAIPHFERAYAADERYTLPLLYAAIAHDGLGHVAAVDSLTRRLRPRRSELAPFDRLVLDILAAASRGDWAGVLTASQDGAEIAPRSLLIAAFRATAALNVNRPHEASRVLATVDEAAAHDLGLSRFWALSAHAAHQTGKYERQLAIGRTVRRRLPNDERYLTYEARALVALRRYAELDVVLAESVTRGRVPQWGSPGLWLHITVADELAAHGAPARARTVLGRALALYYDGRPGSLPEPADSLHIARVLHRVGRYPEARRILERLVAGHPNGWLGVPRAYVRAHLGFVAAAAGDRRMAEEVDRWLTAETGPYHFGRGSQHRAELNALLGNRSLAMRLLQQAAADGRVFDQNMHVTHELQTLRGLAAFEEWLKPRG